MIHEFFVQSAYAAADTGIQESFFSGFVPLILIVLVFYFVLLRPQQKKMKEHQNMTNNLTKGNKIFTSGGIAGKIIAIGADNIIDIEIAKDTIISIKKEHITEVDNKAIDVSSVKKTKTIIKIKKQQNKKVKIKNA